MPKMYVLRCEQKWILESESGKEEHWLVVAQLGDVLEKVLIEFKLFQRIGTVRLHEPLYILREEVVDGRSRVRWLEERVEPAGLIFCITVGLFNWDIFVCYYSMCRWFLDMFDIISFAWLRYIYMWGPFSVLGSCIMWGLILYESLVLCGGFLPYEGLILYADHFFAPWLWILCTSGFVVQSGMDCLN